MWTGNKKCHSYTGSFVRVDILLLLHRASPEGRSWRSNSSTLSILKCASRRNLCLIKGFIFQKKFWHKLCFIGKSLSKGMHFQIFHLKARWALFGSFATQRVWFSQLYCQNVKLSMLVLHIPTMFWERQIRKSAYSTSDQGQISFLTYIICNLVLLACYVCQCREEVGDRRLWTPKWCVLICNKVVG